MYTLCYLNFAIGGSDSVHTLLFKLFYRGLLIVYILGYLNFAIWGSDSVHTWLFRLCYRGLWPYIYLVI